MNSKSAADEIENREGRKRKPNFIGYSLEDKNIKEELITSEPTKLTATRNFLIVHFNEEMKEWVRKLEEKYCCNRPIENDKNIFIKRSDIFTSNSTTSASTPNISKKNGRYVYPDHQSMNSEHNEAIFIEDDDDNDDDDEQMPLQSEKETKVSNEAVRGKNMLFNSRRKLISSNELSCGVYSTRVECVVYYTVSLMRNSSRQK